MKVVLSSDGGLNWDRPSAPFRADRGTATWNALFVLDEQTVFAASSIHAAGEHAIRLRRGRIIPD